MTRAQLEHLLRAAGEICQDDELIVIGSQAILGQFPDAPALLLVSTEADLIPAHHPQRSDLIDGSIGELSPFHETYGYYAQGVDETTATLPSGWRERLVTLRNENTRGISGRCLEVHDLLIAKADSSAMPCAMATRMKRRSLSRPATAPLKISQHASNAATSSSWCPSTHRPGCTVSRSHGITAIPPIA